VILHLNVLMALALIVIAEVTDDVLTHTWTVGSQNIRMATNKKEPDNWDGPIHAKRHAFLQAEEGLRSASYRVGDNENEVLSPGQHFLCASMSNHNQYLRVTHQ
jgi:hypothetical protein